MEVLFVGLCFMVVVVGLVIMINEKLRKIRREKVIKRWKRIKVLEERWLEFKDKIYECKWEYDKNGEEVYVRLLNVVEDELRELKYGKEVR